MLLRHINVLAGLYYHQARILCHCFYFSKWGIITLKCVPPPYEYFYPLLCPFPFTSKSPSGKWKAVCCRGRLTSSYANRCRVCLFFFVFLSWRFIMRPCCEGSVSSHLRFSTVWTPGATWGQTTVDSFDETLILLCLPISLTLGVWHDIKRGKELPRETEGDTDWKEGQEGVEGGLKTGKEGVWIWWKSV